MERINKHKKELFVTWLFFLLIIYFTYCLFLNRTLNCDYMPTYNLPEKPLISQIQSAIAGGRWGQFLTIFLRKAFYVLGINYWSRQWFMQAMGMVLLSMACFVLYYVFSKTETNISKWLLRIGLLVAFISPSFVEGFCFYGPDWGIDILLASLGVLFFSKRRYFISMILVALSVSAYQSMYSIFLCFTCVLIFVDTKATCSKESFVLYFKAFIITIIACLFSIISSRIGAIIFNVNEKKSINIGSSMVEKVSQLIGGLDAAIVHGWGFLPKYLLPIILVICFITGLIYYRKKISSLILYLFGFLGILICPVAYGLVMDGFYYPPRCAITLYFSISAIIIMTYYPFFERASNETRSIFVTKAMVLLMLTLYCLIVVQRVQTGITDILTANSIEKETARRVNEKITEYENETGTTVSQIKIAHYRTALYSFDWNYLRINYYYWPSSHSILQETWADTATLYYVSGRKYERMDMTESEIEQFFGGFNEKTFNSLRRFNEDEQIVFKGDTMYWLLY